MSITFSFVVKKIKNFIYFSCIEEKCQKKRFKFSFNNLRCKNHELQIIEKNLEDMIKADVEFAQKNISIPNEKIIYDEYQNVLKNDQIYVYLITILNFLKKFTQLTFYSYNILKSEEKKQENINLENHVILLKIIWKTVVVQNFDSIKIIYFFSSSLKIKQRNLLILDCVQNTLKLLDLWNQRKEKFFLYSSWVKKTIDFYLKRICFVEPWKLKIKRKWQHSLNFFKKHLSLILLLFNFIALLTTSIAFILNFF